jgi:hypothetical protein
MNLLIVLVNSGHLKTSQLSYLNRSMADDHMAGIVFQVGPMCCCYLYGTWLCVYVILLLLRDVVVCVCDTVTPTGRGCVCMCYCYSYGAWLCVHVLLLLLWDVVECVIIKPIANGHFKVMFLFFSVCSHVLLLLSYGAFLHYHLVCTLGQAFSLLLTICV